MASRSACQAGWRRGTTAACGGKIAVFGAFSGANAGLVIPSLNGAKLAVKQHNAANPNCQVTLQEFDTQGAPALATPFANQVAGDASYLGVIGGHFSGESNATMAIYEAGGLAMISPSATRLDLTAKGNKSFHRVVGHDGTQGEAVAAYLKAQKATKVFIVDDGSAYGAGIIEELKKVAAPVTVERTRSRSSRPSSRPYRKIKASAADFIFYGGYTREAAPLVKQLRAAGVTAKFLGPDGLYDPGFAAGAAGGAEGAIITCPCLPADKAGGTFAADFEKEYGEAPGSYGAEGFDAAKIYLDAFKAGKQTRKDILAFVDAYDKQGVSKYIKFDDNGDVDPSKVVIWSYEVKGTDVRAAGGAQAELVRYDQQSAAGTLSRPHSHPATCHTQRQQPASGAQEGACVNDLLDHIGQHTVNGLTKGSIYALVALGYTLVYGVLRLINFAHSEVFMVGTYAVLTTWTLLGVQSNPSLGVAIGVPPAGLWSRRRRLGRPGAGHRADRLPAAAPQERAAPDLPDHRDRRLADPGRDLRLPAPATAR